MTSFGIDLGTSSAQIALAEKQRTKLIAMDGSSCDVTAVISIDGSEIVVGERANRRLVTHPAQTLRSPLALLGPQIICSAGVGARYLASWAWRYDAGIAGALSRNRNEANGVRALPEPGTNLWSAALGQTPSSLAPETALGQHEWWDTPPSVESLPFSLGSTQRSAIELIALFLDELFERASQQLNENIYNVSIVAPEWMNKNQGAALQTALMMSKLPSPKLVSQSASSVHGIGITDHSFRRVAIIDFGAASTTVTLATVAGGAPPTVLASRSEKIGGEDIDQTLVTIALQQLGYSEPDVCTLEILRQACSAMKKELGSTEVSRYQLPYLPIPGGPLTLTLTRTQLAHAAMPVIKALRQCCDAAFENAHITAEAVSEVYLIGGLSQMRLLTTEVADILGQAPRQSPNPTGLLALGAAKIAEVGLIQECRPAFLPRTAEPLPPPSTIKPPRSTSTLKQPRPTSAPPSRLSVAPGRPSIAASAPAEFRHGTVLNPVQASELHALPLTRALTPADLQDIALPVLLLRVLGRPTVSGTLSLRMNDGLCLSIAFVEGRAIIADHERAALTKAVMVRRGSFFFATRTPSPPPKYPTSMLSVVTECLRSLIHRCTVEDLHECLRKLLSLGPFMSEKRRQAVARLGLTPAENRLVKVAFDGARTGKDLINHGGMGRKTTLQLLTIFEIYKLIEWRQVNTLHQTALADELRHRVKELSSMNHFDALSVHWAADSSEIGEAYERIVKLTSPGGRWYDADAQASRILRVRADEAMKILANENTRTAYRAQTHADKNYEAITDFLRQKAQAASIHSDKSDYIKTMSALREMQKTTSKL